MISTINLFSRLEQKPVFEVMTKEVLGINLPKTAIVRSGNEMIDVAFNEFGNTVGFFGGGFLLDKGLNWFYKDLRKLARTGGTGKSAILWRHTGVSIAICSVLFSLMWAMPFLRNYLTAVRMGTDDYTRVIGSGWQRERAGGDAGFEERKNSYLKTALKTLVMGIGVAALAIFGSRSAIKRGIHLGEALKGQTGLKASLGKLAEKLRTTIGLKNGHFKNFGDIHAALFWGVPAYGGWIHASRDGYEKKEQALKAANFFVWFFALPMAIKRGFVSRYPQALKTMMSEKGLKKVTREVIQKAGLTAADEAKAIGIWKTQSIVSLLSSLTLLGISPAILNIWLTRKRLERDAARAVPFTGTRPAMPSTPLGSLHRKSFEQFILAGYNQTTVTPRLLQGF